MKGRYLLKIRNSKLAYELVLNSNITVLSGNSATGKTTLYDMVSELGKSNGSIHCNMSDKVVALSDALFLLGGSDTLSKYYNGKIIIVDEGFGFYNDLDFVKFVNMGTNYFILITRQPLDLLDYSVMSIMKLVPITGRIVKNISVPMYIDERVKPYLPEIIITEDSNSGNKFFSSLFNIPVVSANGKDNIINTIEGLITKYTKICVIADGAAFGNVANRLMNDREILNSLSVICPESFEYILLSCPTLSRYLNDELVSTEDYCEYTKCLTWEQYFTSLLKNVMISNYDHIRYSKSKLGSFFMSQDFYDKAKEFLSDLDSGCFAK